MELKPAMLQSGRVTPEHFPAVLDALADPGAWSMVCGYTATWGRKPGGR